jgi:ribosome modulation factor
MILPNIRFRTGVLRFIRRLGYRDAPPGSRRKSRLRRISNALCGRTVQPAAMRKKPSRLADTVRMRAWRDRKGGAKPATPPAAPSVLEHWLGKWRESMEERGNSPATVVMQTGHARSFIRWCHGREIRDPSWITDVSYERLCKIHAECHPRGRASGLIALAADGEMASGPLECRQWGGGAGI